VLWVDGTKVPSSTVSDAIVPTKTIGSPTKGLSASPTKGPPAPAPSNVVLLYDVRSRAGGPGGLVPDSAHVREVVNLVPIRTPGAADMDAPSLSRSPDGVTRMTLEREQEQAFLNERLRPRVLCATGRIRQPQRRAGRGAAEPPGTCWVTASLSVLLLTRAIARGVFPSSATAGTASGDSPWARLRAQLSAIATRILTDRRPFRDTDADPDVSVQVLRLVAECLGVGKDAAHGGDPVESLLVMLVALLVDDDEERAARSRELLSARDRVRVATFRARDVVLRIVFPPRGSMLRWRAPPAAPDPGWELAACCIATRERGTAVQGYDHAVAGLRCGEQFYGYDSNNKLLWGDWSRQADAALVYVVYACGSGASTAAASAIQAVVDGEVQALHAVPLDATLAA
jgi:hypothetical protein